MDPSEGLCPATEEAQEPQNLPGEPQKVLEGRGPAGGRPALRGAVVLAPPRAAGEAEAGGDAGRGGMRAPQGSRLHGRGRPVPRAGGPGDPQEALGEGRRTRGKRLQRTVN